jgi:light-harvesting protein B-800-850 alpha chain
MNQGRIWCVVNPTVGLPLFLGSVAVTSLIVHYAVLSHAPWYANFYSGSKAKTAMMDTTAPLAKTTDASGFTITVVPTAGTPGTAETSFVVKVSPVSATGAVAQGPETAAPDRLALATDRPQ